MKSLSSKTYQCGVTIEGLTTLAGITYLTGITNTTSWDHVIVGTTAQGQIYTRTYAQFMTDVATGIGLSGYVPTSRTLSINGVTYDLTANRSWTITTPYVSKLQHSVKAGVAINKGQAVYVTGADGTNMVVGLASNASEATSSKTMGLLDATVTTNGFANVVTEGLLAGLDTSTAGTEGDPVWLGTGGNLIYGLINKPYAPAHLVFIGIVTRKNNSNGEIFVKVQNGFELNEIHDVDLKTNLPVNGELLGFNGTLWVNKTIAGWLGYTPANASGTTNYLSKFTGSTTLGNSLVYDNGTNIGIGTTSPSQKLDVSSNGGRLRISQNINASTFNGLEFADYTGVVDGGLIWNQNTGEIRLNAASSYFPTFYSSGVEAMRIATGGQVIVGGTTVGYAGTKLQVGNTSDSQNGLNILTSTTGYGYILFGDGAGADTYVGQIWYYHGDNYMGFQTNGSEKLRITSTGNVGIGTTTPSYKLEVNGGPINIINGYSDPTAEAGYRLKFADNGGINNDSGIGLSGSLGSESLWINKGSANGNIRFMFGTLGEKVTFTSAGNVGIGTTNPLFTLDVNGSTKLRTATYFGQISQPSAPTLGTNSTTGGTLPADTYTYRISALDFWNAETTPSNSLVVTTTGSTSSVSMSWPLVQGAYNYRIYRTNSGGTTVYFTNGGTNATSFTDTGAAGTVGVTASVNSTAYGFFNTNGTFRSGNIVIANNGVGNTSSITFDKSTDGPSINVVEYANDSTMYEFALRDNPDGGSDFFHWVMPDWQNSSSGWKPLKFSNFVTQIVGQSSNFWSSFSLPSSTPYYTTNPESLANASIKWDPYTSTSYNLPKDNGTGTGVFNVDITGFTGTNNTIYWVIIQAGATTFNWGTGWSGNAPVGTGVAITGGWQTLGDGVQVRIIGSVAASDRWAFRAFPVPKMGIGTTTPVAPLQVSTTVTPTSAVARGVYFNPTLVATANNDVLVGLDIAPTFTNGAFTGITNYALRTGGIIVPSINNTYSLGNATLRFSSTFSTAIYTSIVRGNTVTFGDEVGNNYARFFLSTTGNLLLQNGGTFTDAGYRLDVNGTGIFRDNLKLATGVLSFDGVTSYWGNSIKYESGQIRIYQSGDIHAAFGGSANYLYKNTKISPNLLLTAGGYSNTDGITIWGTQNGANGGDGFVGRNLYYNGTNYVYATTDSSSLWGTVAGVRVLGSSSNALEFVARPATNSGLNVVASDIASYTRMVISYSGNVGIGTTSPSTKFVVSNAGASGLEVDPAGGVGSGVLLQAYNRSTSAYMAQSYYALTHTFNVGSGAGTRALDITSAGNVGIGTTSPAYSLDVVGYIRSSQGYRFTPSSLGQFTISGGNTYFDYEGSFFLRAVPGYSNPLTVTAGGNVGIGTTSPATKLDVSGVITATGGNSTNWNTAYGWGNHSSAGYVPQARTLTINGTTYDLSANRSWTIATTTPGGSNTQFQYNSSGTLAGASALTYDSGTNRVGINQASPGYDLDVNGQVRVQDKLRVGNVNSGNGVVHMSSTATINPSATTIVWSQNVSVGMCAFIEYYILNNNTTTDQRAGTIMVTWNQSGTPTIAHTETTTPDIGSTTPVIFTSSLVGSDARINAVNSSSAPYTIVMSYKYF